MNSSALASPTIAGNEVSSQPPSLAPSPALDVDMTAVSSVSSVSLGASSGAAAGSRSEMDIEDTTTTETNTNFSSNQEILLHCTPTSLLSTFNPAAWTGQIIGSGGEQRHPHPAPAPAAANNAMAQNQPTPAAAFSTPTLVRDGPPPADADSNHLLRSATLYASPDLAALTAIAATTTNTAAPTTNNVSTSAATANNNIMAAAGYGYGHGFGYGYGYPTFPQAFTPSAANGTSTVTSTRMTMPMPMTMPTTMTIDGRIIGAATSRDDLSPTGTTPPLPTPLPAFTHRRHPGMFAGTPLAALGDGGAISRSFFTPGGNFVDLHDPSVEDTTVSSSSSSATTADIMGVSNPFGFSMANYATSASQQGGDGQGQQQPHLNHPGAPFPSLTVAAINEAQMQVQAPTSLQMAAMAAAANGNATDTYIIANEEGILDTARAAAMAQVDAENKQEESSDATTAKSMAKKRGGNAAGTKAKKAKTTKKPRPLPTSSNRPTRTPSAAAATTVPVGAGNTTGRYGSARVSDGASRPFTQEEKDATRCNCKKSRCLQFYCDCFQSGAMCKDDCNCKSCGNTTSNRKRQNVIDDILAHKPEAFMLRAAPKRDVGCSCKKSRCLKLYCACFKAGNVCGDQCICTDCANTGIGGGEEFKPAAVTPRAPPRDASSRLAPAEASSVEASSVEEYAATKISSEIATAIPEEEEYVYQPIFGQHAEI